MGEIVGVAHTGTEIMKLTDEDLKRLAKGTLITLELEEEVFFKFAKQAQTFAAQKKDNADIPPPNWMKQEKVVIVVGAASRKRPAAAEPD